MIETDKRLIIAVDFDGTIVEHKYPIIGEERPGAVEYIKRLIRDGHQLILWSVREGELLDEAVAWCRERGIEFFTANKDYPEEQASDKYYSRKLKVDLFIDDRNLGGLPSWDVIYNMISKGKAHQPPSYSYVIDDRQSAMMDRYRTRKRKWWER